MILGVKQSGVMAKKILDFYHDIYFAKFKDKPIINGGRDMRALKEFFDYNDFSLDFLKACVIVYLSLENAWLEEQGYPMWSFPDRVFICKKELDYNYKFFKGEKEEFYQDYVKKTLDKLEANNDEGREHRQQNSEPQRVD